MATIEERAREIYHVDFEGVEDYRKCYIKGATEQEAITKQETIARTCEWMRNHNTGEEVIEQYVKDMEE